MPIYEYQCPACQTYFDKLQKVSDLSQVPCPHCGKMADRLISAPGFQLKGQGWYVTDYRGKPKTGSDSEKPAAAPSEPKAPSAPKTDTEKK